MSAEGTTTPAHAIEPSPPLPTEPTGVRSEAAVLTAMLGAVLLYMLAIVLPAKYTGRIVEVERLPEHRLDYRVDINTANLMELEHLPGVGPKLAQRIIDHRNASGVFRSVGELRRVKGIGPKILERLRQYVAPLPGDEPSVATMAPGE